MISMDESVLRKRSAPVKDTKEGGEVARKLWAALERVNKKAAKPAGPNGPKTRVQGVGLAAPQVGIHKQVCVIKTTRPLVLMNPRIVGHSQTRLPFEEGCLSFPGKRVETYRYVWVVVQTLNLGVLSFGPRTPEEWTPAAFLDSVVVQHEVAHLSGLLMTDFTTDDYPHPEEWEAWDPKPAGCSAGSSPSTTPASPSLTPRPSLAGNAIRLLSHSARRVP